MIEQPADPLGTNSFSSSDEDEVTEFIRTTYADNRLRFLTQREGSRFRATCHSSPTLSAERIRSTVDYVAALDPLEDIVFFVAEHGRVRLRQSRTELMFGPGRCGVIAPHSTLSVEQRDVALRTLRLPLARVAQQSEEVSGMPRSQFAFTAIQPATAAMDRHWQAVLSLASNALLDADSAVTTSPLLVEELTRLVSVAALETFPNTSTAHGSDSSRGGAGRPSLRRAVEFIDANAQRPVTVGDIAAAAGTSPRSLQYAFRELYDTTPLAYLRRVRLAGAHRDLRAGDPSRGDTVAAIAARWGFAKPGRFAHEYRNAYGQAPGHVLRN